MNELLSHLKKEVESLSLFFICHYDLGRGGREITMFKVTAEWMTFSSPLHGGRHENQVARTGCFVWLPLLLFASTRPDI